LNGESDFEIKKLSFNESENKTLYRFFNGAMKSLTKISQILKPPNSKIAVTILQVF